MGKHIPLHFCAEEGPLTDVCFINSDSNDARTLAYQFEAGNSVTGGVTVEDCINECSRRGFPFAGVEFANQCCTCRLFVELSFPE